LATLVATALAAPEQRVFSQRLDHFNPQDLRTWNQYYLANRDNYITGGPVFIYVGSDAYEVYYEYITRGLVYDISAELGGYMFTLEPRFYGQSRPTK
jgi:Serine carboxypeptidase S28